jgi:sulfite exporter TauE/SafE
MCGPIAFSLGLNSSNTLDFTTRNLTYQFGRVTTYTLMGAILGILGLGASFAGIQQPLSIGVGIMMICMAILPKNLGSDSFGFKPFSQLMLKIKMGLGKYLRQKKYSSLYITGILNGLLPCGAVYAALTGSIAMGSIQGGAFFMSLFGLGTIPLMYTTVLMGNAISVQTREKILKFLPYVMIILGILFILRGLNLDIPFISPASENLEVGVDGHEH